MNSFIYGLIAAITITITDLSRKCLSLNNCDNICITTFPLILCGLISFIYLYIKNNDLKYQYIMLNYNWIYIIIITIGIILTHYCINCALSTVNNPGYAKAIIASNILITTFFSILIFKSEISIIKILGIILIIIGINLLI